MAERIGSHRESWAKSDADRPLVVNPDAKIG